MIDLRTKSDRHPASRSLRQSFDVTAPNRRAAKATLERVSPLRLFGERERGGVPFLLVDDTLGLSCQCCCSYPTLSARAGVYLHRDPS
jgi:hypothetical protein